MYFFVVGIGLHLQLFHLFPLSFNLGIDIEELFKIVVVNQECIYDEDKSYQRILIQEYSHNLFRMKIVPKVFYAAK